MRLPGNIINEVMQRDYYTCQMCGTKKSLGNKIILHVHHINPKVKGGSNKLANLILLCLTCHAKFHHGLENLYKKNFRKVREDFLGTYYERCY